MRALEVQVEGLRRDLAARDRLIMELREQIKELSAKEFSWTKKNSAVELG